MSIAAEDQKFFDELLKSLRVHAPKLQDHQRISIATDVTLKMKKQIRSDGE